MNGDDSRLIEPDPGHVCPICDKPTDYLERYHDRHGCYSGRACSDRCARSLPGQGAMWDYELEHGEALEEPA